MNKLLLTAAALALLGVGCVGSRTTVKLINAASKMPIAHADVRVWSDNGIRCIQAPCETEGKEWTGKTDQEGFISIPRRAINIVTIITANGFSGGKYLDRDAKSVNGDLVLELDPDSTTWQEMKKIWEYERANQDIPEPRGRIAAICSSKPNKTPDGEQFVPMVPGQVVMYVKKGVTRKRVDEFLARYNLLEQKYSEDDVSFNEIGLLTVRVPVGFEECWIDEFPKEPEVESAFPNFLSQPASN